MFRSCFKILDKLWDFAIFFCFSREKCPHVIVILILTGQPSLALYIYCPLEMTGNIQTLCIFGRNWTQASELSSSLSVKFWHLGSMLSLHPAIFANFNASKEGEFHPHCICAFPDSESCGQHLYAGLFSAMCLVSELLKVHRWLQCLQINLLSVTRCLL